MKKNNLIIALILVVIGLALLLLQAKMPQTEEFWRSVIGNAASAILICGVLGLLQETISKRDHTKELRELFCISSAIKDSGLVNIMIDSQLYNYSDLLSTSDVFYAILNDGRGWVTRYDTQLIHRFSTKTKATELFLVDPEGKFADALAQKTGRSLESLQGKIQETLSLLSELYLQRSSREGTLRIYLLKNYPTQSIFYTDTIIITTSYQTSSGRNTVPLFEYKYDKSSTNIAKDLYHDLDQVREESKLIFDNGPVSQ